MTGLIDAIRPMVDDELRAMKGHGEFLYCQLHAHIMELMPEADESDVAEAITVCVMDLMGMDEEAAHELMGF